MNNKRNVVLYLDKELIEKTRELGFNLSKTFENHLKQLLTQFSTVSRAFIKKRDGRKVKQKILLWMTSTSPKNSDNRI
jgi:hypothetical protein